MAKLRKIKFIFPHQKYSLTSDQKMRTLPFLGVDFFHSKSRNMGKCVMWFAPSIMVIWDSQSIFIIKMICVLSSWAHDKKPHETTVEMTLSSLCGVHTCCFSRFVHKIFFNFSAFPRIIPDAKINSHFSKRPNPILPSPSPSWPPVSDMRASDVVFGPVFLCFQNFLTVKKCAGLENTLLFSWEIVCITEFYSFSGNTMPRILRFPTFC